MICRRCGMQNLPNVYQCVRCGSPLGLPDQNNQKETEKLLIALIIILIVVLGIVVVALISYMSGPKVIIEESTETVTETVKPTVPPEPIMTPEPIETPKPVATPNVRLSKKSEFIQKAEDIEWYYDTYAIQAMTQSEINYETGVVYQKWDSLLNEVYQYLKTTMPYNEFEKLKADEHRWIKQKEQAIDAAGAEWEGGSGEPMARNTAGIEQTSDRCYYLISLIN